MQAPAVLAFGIPFRQNDFTVPESMMLFLN